MTAAPMRSGGVRSWLRDVFLNLGPCAISHALMRLTGLALVVYLFLHIWTVGAVRRSAATRTPAESFDAALRAYDTPAGHLVEFLLLACVVVHGLCGLRIVVADWFGLTRLQRGMLWWVAAAGAAILAVAVPFFFPYLVGR
ncbi:MAG: hypothetical protein QME96_03610 [Myxococcota bacterium]|nr:hypothetical protein [Myxococcota bacterium]